MDRRRTQLANGAQSDPRRVHGVHRIEKENHALANPDYHKRPQKAVKSKKAEVEGEEEELREAKYLEKESPKDKEELRDHNLGPCPI